MPLLQAMMRVSKFPKRFGNARRPVRNVSGCFRKSAKACKAFLLIEFKKKKYT